MKEDLKSKWVSALRGGEFAQTTGNLKDGDGYCCLGVLCVVAGAEWKEHDKYDEIIMEQRYFSNVPVLNGDCLSAGEDQELGDVGMQVFGITPDVQKTLVEMNDGWEDTRKHSFPEIADYIEKNL